MSNLILRSYIGVNSQTERDRLGRVISHQIQKNSSRLSEKSYLWGVNDKLLGITTNGKTKHFEYDTWGNLSKTVFEDGRTELRNPDKAGNLFESLDRLDRKYSQGGRLEKTANWEYKYDREGNLIRKKDKHGATWRYEWNDAGMLESVKRPDAREVFYKYDALGRRIEKNFDNAVTKWVWDGNVPLHEQQSSYWKQYSKEKGEYWDERKQPLVTWVFEEGTFVPVAKLTDKQKLSIATNYLGTPEAMYRDDGEAVWTCELNSYGKVRNFQGQYVAECPFRFQGQYHDSETGLYYNRFRYYSPEEGMYISQDPIELDSQETNFYAYVRDINIYVDSFGLSCKKVPNKAKGIKNYVNNNGGSGVAKLPSPPFARKGSGSPFRNRPNKKGKTLPTHDSNGKPIKYHEYDVKVDPKVRGTGSNRGGHRVVMGSDGKSYYTHDHYETFTEF